MKIVYLDQLHWIEIAKAIIGKPVKKGTLDVLAYMISLSHENQAIFPLSLSHYYETLKHYNPDKRLELTRVMRLLSRGKTVSPFDRTGSHEIQVALKHFFPCQIIPEPFSYIGSGFEHALGKELNLRLGWPKSMPEYIRTKLESDVSGLFEEIFLSGVMRFEEIEYLFPKYDTTAEDKFKQHLEEWKGIALRLSQKELERLIYSITFNDILAAIMLELRKFNISNADFYQIGEQGMCRLLDLMPSRKVDMHLRLQWAKNRDLTPKQSDLNDWCFIGSAVCYSDIVVTEKQMKALFSTASGWLKAGVTSNLTDLMKLITMPDKSLQRTDTAAADLKPYTLNIR